MNETSKDGREGRERSYLSVCQFTFTVPSSSPWPLCLWCVSLGCLGLGCASLKLSCQNRAHPRQTRAGVLPGPPWAVACSWAGIRYHAVSTYWRRRAWLLLPYRYLFDASICSVTKLTGRPMTGGWGGKWVCRDGGASIFSSD